MVDSSRATPVELVQTDYVDAVLLHRIDTLFELNEVAEAFDALESSGKVPSLN